MGKYGLFDLERQYAFHGAYHSNQVNTWIHMLFIWPIFFTFLVLFYFTPPLFDCPFQSCLGLVPNFGLPFTMTYVVYYVCLDRKAGSLAAFLCLFCWISASLLAKHLGFSLAWKVVLGVQLFCWTTQLIGHVVFEKRSPPLVENFAQALLMVPYFVLLEALQSFFGYEPYPGFNASVKARKDAEIQNLKDDKEKKIS
ncbi:2-hydroxy-palmitic acid dioxygenase mpo1-like [Rhododendron vialii]|uniref:2-hydroxy-palmitic acid dioxygenase mpo1-like n=1 Tax=Rhododendron vialii TaxID=182163 RepID=UPI00265F79B8|nr:2-hydroxy-palmitic acid dioxygenase mpo1-like [Rhododendron vialii]